MFTHPLSPDTASWLLDMLLKSAVLLALAGLATWACRRASAAQRHLIWMLAVIGVLLLPVLSAILPAWHVLRLPAWQPTLHNVPAPVSMSVQPLERPAGMQETSRPMPDIPSAEVETPEAMVASPKMPTTPATPARTIPSPPHPAWPWYVWVTLAWGIGSALVLAWWGYGYALTRRLLAHDIPAPEAWGSEIPAGVRLLMSGEIAMPVVTGIRRPAILLPAQAAKWDEERRRAVLIHELAHLRRRDLHAHLLAQLACACYWMNPLAWLAAHRLRVEREIACDDAVLGANVKPSDYAAHLLAVAGGLQGRRFAPVMGIAMARSSKVGRRIKGVLDERMNRQALSPRAIGIMLLIAIPGLAFLAAAQEPRVHSAPARIPLPRDTGLVVVSPDGGHVAFVETVIGGQRMVIDGQPGPVFPRIRAPWMLYDEPVDFNAQQAPQQQLHTGIFFSPDGTRVAYVIEVQNEGKKQQAVVIDGKAGPYYDDVTLPTFSPDSKHLSYGAGNGNEWRVVVDETTSKAYRTLGSESRGKSLLQLWKITFSADGSRMGYYVRTVDNRWLTVIDGKEGPAYQRVYELAISPDGRHVAYVAERNNRQFIVYDGGEKPAYDEVRYPTFSPDGRRFAYVARRGSISMVVAGGYEGRAYTNIVNPPIFSPNSTSLAYHAIQEQSGKHVAVAVLNGNEVTWRQNLTLIDGMQFSPDSHRLAFTAHTPHGYTRLFIHGEGVYHTIQYAYAPVFSPSGLRVAYLIQQGRKVGIGVDATTLPTSLGDIPLYITFSPDSRHLVTAMGTAGTTQITMTVDGQPIGQYERLAGAEGDNGAGKSDIVFFDAPDRFHFYAVKDGAVQRIDATLPAPANTSPFSINLTPQPGNATISAYEPVVMNYRTVNTSSKAIELPAWATEFTLRLEVYNAQGQLLAATPVRDVPGDFLHTVQQLKPGEGVEQTLVISAFYTFAKPGRYTVRATQLAPFYPLEQAVQIQGIAEAEVTVLPFDDQRLQARIAQHWNAMREHRGIGANPKILYSMRHNRALPALEWMIREWGDHYAARTIIRIDTHEARQLLKRLRAEPGQAGKAIRGAEKLSVGIDMWDIEGSTAKHILPPDNNPQLSPTQPLTGGSKRKMFRR